MSDLHRHHRKLRSQGGDDSTENIMLVTPEMHEWIHRNPGEAYERGWLVKSWQDPAEVPIQSWPEAFSHTRLPEKAVTHTQPPATGELPTLGGVDQQGWNDGSIPSGEPEPPKAGETCPTCNRRVNHPKKETSPESRVKSLRIPADDDTFDDDFARAMNIVGLTSEHKYVSHKFLRFVVDCIFRDEEEWAGAYLEEWDAA